MEPDLANSDINPSAWLDIYGDYLYSYALSRVSPPDNAQDLVQETLLAAYRTHQKFTGKSTVKTWLTTILRSKIVDFYRSKGHKIVVSWEDFKSPFRTEDPMKGHWIENKPRNDWNVDAISQIESQEFVQVLSKCLDHLPENWRSVVILKLLEDHKSEDVCKELDISSSNLWVIVHRAKLKLRDCLEKNWFNEIRRDEQE